MDRKTAASLIESMSEKDVSDLTGYLIQHRLDQVLAGNDDVDSMANNAISTLFSKSNVLSVPTIIAPGIVAVPCYTQYVGKKHRCANATVKSGESEAWCWDESFETFISGSRADVENAVRSVSLHTAIVGLRIIRHYMEYDGERHKRVKDECFIITDEGEDPHGDPLFGIERDNEFIAGRLPLPSNR